VAVIGAGVVGAVAAVTLARAGATVTVLHRHRGAGREAGSVPPEATTRPASFSRIHAGDTGPGAQEDLHRLRRLAMGTWPRLAAGLPADVGLRWGGRVVWAPPPPPAAHGVKAPRPPGTMLQRGVRILQSWGYPVEQLDGAGVREREPALVLPDGVVWGTRGDAFAAPGASAVFFGEEGHVEAERVIDACLAVACMLGADVRGGAEVTGIVQDPRSGVQLELADGGLLAADVALLAAGASTPALGAQLGVHLPQLHRFGGVARTAPLASQLLAEPGRVLEVMAGEDHPGFLVRQCLDGSALVRLQGRPLTAAQLSTGVGESEGEDAAQTAAKALAVAARFLPALAGVAASPLAGVRPIPGDGRPVVGYLAPSVYTIFTDSGVTLSPLVSTATHGQRCRECRLRRGNQHIQLCTGSTQHTTFKLAVHIIWLVADSTQHNIGTYILQKYWDLRNVAHCTPYSPPASCDCICQPLCPASHYATIHNRVQLAQLAAMEILEGAQVSLLADFRPARFATVGLSGGLAMQF